MLSQQDVWWDGWLALASIGLFVWGIIVLKHYKEWEEDYREKMTDLIEERKMKLREERRGRSAGDSTGWESEDEQIQKTPNRWT